MRSKHINIIISFLWNSDGGGGGDDDDNHNNEMLTLVLLRLCAFIALFAAEGY
jgi:hypothetical protein